VAHERRRLYFDFGSPNAYLSHKVIPAIEARTVRGSITSSAARRPIQAYRQPFAGRGLRGIKNKLAYEGLETRRFVRRHGLTAYRPTPIFRSIR